MGYRLKPGQPLDRDLRRIAASQLDLALTALRTRGNRLDAEAIHRARRHIKKLRSLVRLARGPLADTYHPTARRLGQASRLLAPMADAEAVVRTFDRLRAAYPDDGPGDAFAAVRTGLIQREARTDRQARRSHVKEAVTRALRAERKAVDGWELGTVRFRAIAPGLERTVRRGRRAMARALDRPTAASYHVWRQRVKDLWLQVRLVQRLTGGALAEYERQVEGLDGCLGELHNCALLEQVLTRDALVSRPVTAACLRVIRQDARRLRQEARDRGTVVHADSPREFVRRVRRLRRRAKAGDAADGERTSWPHAA